MNSKRIFSIVMSITLLASLMVGCEKKSKPTGQNAANGNSNDTLELTWLGPPLSPSAKEGTFPQKLLEEKFNIKIKPVFLDADAYKTKKPIMMASGEVPDLIYELDPINVQMDVSQGYLMELPYETIKKFAPAVVKQINKEEPAVWLFSNSNGKNYGVPNLNPDGKLPRLGMWRKDWLKNVGIDKVPETLDEMHTAFVKFVNEDPDKNGKKDTYGMSGDVKNQYLSFTEIFGAYGVTPFNWMLKDNQIVYGGTRPEVKKALKVLRDWYKEGLIHPDFITDDIYKSGADRFTNGKIGYINSGALYGFNNEAVATSQISVMKKINPNAEIALAPHPKGPEEKSGAYTWGGGGHIVALGRQLEKQPEKVERILKIMESELVEQEFSLKLRVGEKGKHWDEDTTTQGVASKIKPLPPYDDRRQSDNECFRAALWSISFYAILPADPSLSAQYRTKEGFDFNNKVLASGQALVDPLLKADTVPSASKYFADLKNKQVEAFVRIISGDNDISYYDEFVNLWNTQGGDQLTKEAQSLQGMKESIYKQVGVNEGD